MFSRVGTVSESLACPRLLLRRSVNLSESCLRCGAEGKVYFGPAGLSIRKTRIIPSVGPRCAACKTHPFLAPRDVGEQAGQVLVGVAEDVINLRPCQGVLWTELVAVSLDSTE